VADKILSLVVAETPHHPDVTAALEAYIRATSAADSASDALDVARQREKQKAAELRAVCERVSASQ
jgi:hypothetical protein